MTDDRCIVVFDTANAALWGEEVAKRQGIPAEVIPAPAESDSKCDLALVCRLEDVHALEAALQGDGVPFRRFRP